MFHQVNRHLAQIQTCFQACFVMLCYVMWNLFTVGSLQYPNDGTITSLEANQNRV